MAYRIDGGNGSAGVTPTANYRLFEGTAGPSTSSNDGNPVSMGVEFDVADSNHEATKLWYHRSATAMGDSGTVLGQIYQISGGGSTGIPLIGTPVSFPTPTTLGWQSVDLPTPVSLTSGTDYKAVVYFPDGEYTTTADYWASGPGSTGLSIGPLSAPNHADSASGQNSFSFGSGIAYPTGNFNGANYWIDVTISGPAG
jgi:hypothetical protein